MLVKLLDVIEVSNPNKKLYSYSKFTFLLGIMSGFPERPIYDGFAAEVISRVLACSRITLFAVDYTM